MAAVVKYLGPRWPMLKRPNRRILIVDDEEAILHALERSLRAQPYQLFTAGDGAEALELLKKQKVDMVISDHLMPNMTGLEFLKLARDRYPDAMRVMLTGHADMQIAVDGINHGAIYRFLTKPWDDTELKVMLFLAFEQLDLEGENRRLLLMARRQYELLEKLEVEFPGIEGGPRDSSGAIHLDAETTGDAAGAALHPQDS